MKIVPTTLDEIGLRAQMNKDAIQSQVKAVFFVLGFLAVVQIAMLALILWRVW